MKSVIIYYFSGTGNTELVANMVKEGFTNYKYKVSVVKIEDVLKKNLEIDVEKYDLVGIGCQVIGFGMPNIVYKFINSMPKVLHKKMFIFRTAGGVAPINYNSSRPIIIKLSKKGYEVFYERMFSISSNWIDKFDEIIIKKLYEATTKKVDIMCKEVINGESRILKTGIGLKVIMIGVMSITRWIFPLIGKDLSANESCTHCGLCIRNCPTRNIYESNGKIKFNFSCCSCMRCVYSCPKTAINYRVFTFFRISDGYNIKKIIGQPLDDSQINSKKVPKFYYNYISNDTM